MPSASVSVAKSTQSLTMTDKVSRDIWDIRLFCGGSTGALAGAKLKSWGSSSTSPSPDLPCLSSSNFWDASDSGVDSATSHFSLNEIMNIKFMIPMIT